jgi:hypothetical protein
MQGDSYVSLQTARKALGKEPNQESLVFCGIEAFSAIRPEACDRSPEMKFQEIVDAALSVRDARRAPQAPSVALKEREQAVQDQSGKIETVRAVRLADAGKLLSEPLLFEVVRYRGRWRTLHGGKRSTPFADQAAAILAAKKLARLKVNEGYSVQVILRRMDGQSVIQSIDTDECRSSN